MCSYIVAMIANVPQLSLAYTNMPCILINSIFWVIASIICIYKKKRHIASTKLIFSKPIYIAITLGAISFLLTISAVQSIGNDYNVPYNQTNFLGFLWSTICIIFFILFIWLSRAISKKNELQREKDLINIHMLEQEKYIKLVIDKDIAMRKFKHDVKEHMNIIYSYINESSYEESKNYIKKMYDVFNDSQVIRYTGINAVDAIISDKKSYMDEHNITFNMNPSICEFPQRIEIFDICTVFINILTNAIEACEMLETNDRYIDLSVSIYDNKILICESNKYLDPILFDEKGNPISTKKDSQNHGLGSKNIRTVIEKYNGELQYHCEDGVFSIEIIVVYSIFLLFIQTRLTI